MRKQHKNQNKNEYDKSDSEHVCLMVFNATFNNISLIYRGA